MEFLAIVNRFCHVLFAVIGVGGLFVLWRLVFPSLELLEQEQQELVVNGFAKIWRMVLWHAYALLLLTGIFSAILGWRANMTWQLIVGVKMVLAIGVSALGVYLTLPGLSAKALIERKSLYPFAVFIGFAVIAAGAVLRFER